MDEIHALSFLRGPGCNARVALRGGNWDNGANARAAVALNLNNPVGNWSGNIGFRAALPGKPEVETLRGFRPVRRQRNPVPCRASLSGRQKI